MTRKWGDSTRELDSLLLLFVTIGALTLNRDLRLWRSWSLSLQWLPNTSDSVIMTMSGLIPNIQQNGAASLGIPLVNQVSYSCIRPVLPGDFPGQSGQFFFWQQQCQYNWKWDKKTWSITILVFIALRNNSFLFGLVLKLIPKMSN